jgi:hypothetical protein
LIVLSISLFSLAGLAQEMKQAEPTYESSRQSAYFPLRSRIEGYAHADTPDKCGLPVIAEAMVDRIRLAPEERAALDLLLQREERQKFIVAGSFRIHYDTVGVHAPAMLDSSHQRIEGTANEFADSVAAIINYVARFDSVIRYLLPPSDGEEGGSSEYDIYIGELGNLYGETTPETKLDSKPDGSRYTTFMRIDNDFIFVNPASNRGMPALRVTLAHEFHHAIQVGSYGFWTNDVYFYEISSVWMEDLLYTDVNDYYQYLASSQGHFDQPDIPFNSNMLVMYSRGIWGHYVTKKYGLDAMRRSWEFVSTNRPLEAIDNALQEDPYSSNFRSAFAEWTLWNLHTGIRSDTSRYYPEADDYPDITQTVVQFTPPSRSVAGSLGTLAARYYRVLTQTNDFILILSNLNFEEAVEDNNTLFPYSLQLNVNQVDASYEPTATGIFVKLNVSDPTNWWTWGTIGGTAEGVVFPNPFLTDGRGFVTFSVSAQVEVSGTLNIYSSSMDLVYSTTEFSSQLLEEHVFRWGGRTNDNELAQSGVYIFVLELPDRIVKGKFALIRK